ncbi:MAG: alpha-L-rhamnosidase [Phycisphaerae bacterium]|jgi:hypothetical protein
MPASRRVLIDKPPFNAFSTLWDYGSWRARWIGVPSGEGPGSVSSGVAPASAVLAFRREVVLDQPATCRIHVSADQRYRLFLDGQRIGQGPERGCFENWFYETYDLDLEAGRHVLVAQVWWLSLDAPPAYAQMTAQAAFLLAAEGPLAEHLDTGVAPWQVRVLGGYSFLPPGDAWGTGAKLRIRGADFSWGFQTGQGDGWSAVAVLNAAVNASQANEFKRPWMLSPATLPPMLEETVRPFAVRHVQTTDGGAASTLPVRAKDHLPAEAGQWQAMFDGKGPLTLPPRTSRRVIVDLQDYYCAYPQLTVSGGAGATVRISWAEALYEMAADGSPGHAATKGNRREILNKVFDGIGDVFEPDGGRDRAFETLWWQAGRYLEILVQTGDAPLVLQELTLRQTHYPYEFEGAFACSDPAMEEVIPRALRTLEMCSHETYMDCPYYEQLMYVGDARLEAMVTYACCRDDRLPRKAITLFDLSRTPRGLTQSRFPSRVMQIIPPFSLYWVSMVHDYLMWRRDRDFVLRLLPGVRGVLESFRQNLTTQGLLNSPSGWNFMDWVPAWPYGISPGGLEGQSGLLNWHLVMTLREAQAMERLAGEDLLAQRDGQLAESLAAATDRAFWDESRGLYADDLEHRCFSEHTQCLAILSGLLAPEKRRRVADGLLTAPDLTRTTIYFSHYLFEAYRQIGRMDAMAGRMGPWLALKDLGCTTTLEMPEPSRSDCHAWAAHPLYHYLASVLGIRPAAPLFASVLIEPQLGTLTRAAGTIAHPDGLIAVELHTQAGRLDGMVELPPGLTGELIWKGKKVSLRGGRQDFTLD